MSLIFIGTASVEINLERVRARVLRGGHDVPEAAQRRRFPRTLAKMKRLLPIVDFAVLFDNSSEMGYELVGSGSPFALRWRRPVPIWAQALKGFES